MIRHLVVIIVLILKVPTVMWAHQGTGNVPENTITVIEREFVTVVSEALRHVGDGSDVELTVASHPDQSWFRGLALTAAGSRRLFIVDGAPNSIEIVPRNIGTTYLATDNDDTVVREVRMLLDVIITKEGKTHVETVAPSPKVTRCSRADALRTQSLQHTSTHAELPPQHRTFWDDIVEPVVFIAAAITTAALLFTVRSQ
ncbi:MAG TPA: hypothetical protein DIS79_07425 [Bacteroidetes bacterium]|nr:hypothetical protein [Bacteroidota bacterium]HRK05736.1 hypothetical protein [Chlorobiota bacterium]